MIYKMKWIKIRWNKISRFAVVLAMLLVRVHCIHAAIIPATPTYTSTEFTAIQTEMADIGLALGYSVVAVIGVCAVTMIFKIGRKVLRKLSP